MLLELKRTCDICFEPYEKKENILFLEICEHIVCSKCYPKIKNCHICREKLTLT